MWRRSRHFISCREICADAKLLFMFFYFERLPYLPTAKHHITQQLVIGLSFLYGHIFCTSSIGFLLTYWVFTPQSTEVWHQLATQRHNMQITSAELAWMLSKIIKYDQHRSLINICSMHQSLPLIHPATHPSIHASILLFLQENEAGSRNK